MLGRARSHRPVAGVQCDAIFCQHCCTVHISLEVLGLGTPSKMHKLTSVLTCRRHGIPRRLHGSSGGHNSATTQLAAGMYRSQTQPIFFRSGLLITLGRLQLHASSFLVCSCTFPTGQPLIEHQSWMSYHPVHAACPSLAHPFNGDPIWPALYGMPQLHAAPYILSASMV